ncbi:LysM peptidoglycan-binding domain-containing protein [Rhizobium mesosinicum]|uniref:LysM peptidoglycan-binding domain-containing protein n=1 Tax=Rhizobium mesosinicum TaxID=335017 RepID=A0ABS7GTQ1_9HYPH|nr:LysM peptidoglycan-binding domain-containing protein [Rhizobium mesosinicum]MBW9053037.1 LysM peptidoglycan-binding domain-containing protein [Rhizobium mesosinicum]
MMKNRAGLLALAVLVIAIILMVFFVMPRLGSDVAKVGDAINQAGTEVNNTVNETSKTSRSAVADAAEAAQKIGSLTADAVRSLSGLKALFADGKVPAADALAGAKTAAVNTLTAIVDFAAPEGLDTTTAGLVSKAKDGAGKARDIVQTLPENAVDALAALARAEAALTGASEPAGQPAAANGQTAADTASNGGPKIPAFDVLRVEPDGSTVIAGSAEPNGKLEVLDGDKVVVTTDVDGTGDFAAVLDNPLPAGDHQLVLKVTGKDGKTTLSEEVATVSVPKDGSGSELLAMVSKPGTASRIITAPKAEVADAQTPTANDAAVAAAGNQPADNTQPAPNGAPNDQVAMQTANTPVISNNAIIPGTQQGNAAAADVMINAVEIEGNKIFVAGTARSNAKVVGYADDALIGQDTAEPDGHFVISGAMNLSVGDHKIRVDVVDGSGKVLVRATVNFNRPEGNQVTVAAQSGSNANQAMVPLDEGQLGKLEGDATKAFGLLKGLFADGKVPGAEQLAAARSATEFALRALVDFRPGIDATDAFKQASASASRVAANALTMLQSLPKDAKSVGAALDKLGAIIAELTAPGADVAPMPSNEVSAGGQPKTIEQAPLTANNNAVIIRRGDTLWQISRRTYGLGVRYTTIYIANEDKILNPDRIRPGQVFGLPKDALPNAEELHRKRLSGGHL